MKKLLLLIFVLCLFKVSFSQTYPSKQIIGTTQTMVVDTGGMRIKGVFMLGHFVDTGAANAVSYIKNYAYGMITTDDNLVWMRDKTAKMWLQVLLSGGSPSTDTLVWKLGGQYLDALSGFAVLGSKDSVPIYFITNNLKRLGIPENGIESSSDPANKVLTWNPSSKYLFYTDSAGSGGGGFGRIGLIDSLGKSTNGASTNGSSLFMQTATSSVPGLLSAADKAKIDSLNNIFWYAIQKTGYLSTAYRPNDSTIYGKALLLTMPAELTVTPSTTDTTGVWSVTYTGGRNPFVDSIDAITVKNIADLRATDYQNFSSYKKASNDRPMINVAGYYNRGDGGGGQFYWDDTATVSDNGGSIIKPTSVSGAGRWKRPDKGYMDVLEFGATRSYTTIPGTDSRDNFINAINAEIAYQLNNGPSGLTGVYSTGTLRIPAGNYTISDSIKISNSITIIGEDDVQWPSNSTRLFFPVNKRGFIFSRRSDGTGARNIRMKNIYLSSAGLSTDTLCHGIKANCNVDFYNVSVENFGGHGIYLTTLDSGDCSNSKIYNCLMFYNQLHGFYVEGGESNNMVISGCNSRTNGGSNFYDNSFLGNHYEFNHAASAGGRPGQRGWVRYGGYEYCSIGAENIGTGAINRNIRPDSVGAENYWQKFTYNAIDTNIVSAWNRTSIYPITASYVVGNVIAGCDFMNDYDEGGIAGVVLNLGSIAWNGDLANGVARPWMTWHRMGGGFFKMSTGVMAQNVDGDSSYVKLDGRYGLTFGKEITQEGAFYMKYDTAAHEIYGSAAGTIANHSFTISTPYSSPTSHGWPTIKPAFWTWSPAYGFGMAAMTNSTIKRNILGDVALPTTGTHTAGDFCINLGADSTTIGWRCYVSGTPGTWYAVRSGNAAGSGSGTVTSVATNTATGITGGTITATGTLAIDTTLISTRLWRQKGIDSINTLLSGKQDALSGTGYSKWSGSTPSYLTPTQVTADLNVFTSSLQGLVPASGGSARMVLHGDGTWKDTTAAGGGMTYPGAGIANSTGSAWGTSYTTTGSGTVLALATSPTFVTPLLGTPTSGVLTNTTGYKLSSLSPATTGNSIDNNGNGQVWNFTGLAGTDALKLASTSTAAASNASTVLNITTDGTNATSSQTTYGAQILNNHIGTSATSIGLLVTAKEAETVYALKAVATNGGLGDPATSIAGYFSASGGTSQNSAIIVPASGGNVGIGTSSPGASSLHIVSAPTNGEGVLASTSTLTSGTLMSLVGTSTVLAANNEVLNISSSGSNGTNAITATGARISVTNTNGTSGTNVGLDITASGATTANIAIQAVGHLTFEGVTSTGATGTGNLVYHTSPTFGTQIISPILYGSSSASGGVQIGSTSNGTKGVITMLDSVNFNGKSIEGYTAKYNVQTGTSYTLVAADAGKIITISNGSAITLTVPASLPAGFTCTVIQLGAGQITFTASSTTINNRQSYTKTAGQYAVATITQYTTNTFATAGDMQ